MPKALYMFNSDEIIKPVLPSSETKVQYPSDYFAASPGKPKLTIHAYDVELGSCLFNGLIRGTANVDAAIAFIYHTINKYPIKCSEEWSSFNNNICKADADCQLSNLFHQQDSTKVLTLTEKASSYSEARDEKWLLLALVAPFRLIACTHDDYRGKIVPLIENKLQGLGKASTVAIAIDSFHTKYASWATNPTYRKLIAGVDMYFTRFREHDLAILRMGTLTSRFKDCAALLGVGYTVNLLGIDIDELAEWILVEKMGREYKQLMKEEQEIDLTESYMPYLMDLGLSKKSPYSSAANPNLHTWFHTVGCTFKMDRSKHARMMPDACVTDVLTNGQLISFAFIKATNLELTELSSSEIRR